MSSWVSSKPPRQPARMAPSVKAASSARGRWGAEKSSSLSVARSMSTRASVLKTGVTSSRDLCHRDHNKISAMRHLDKVVGVACCVTNLEVRIQ